jgi:hypothetical protein
MEDRDDPPRSGAEGSPSSPLSLDAARERLRERGYLERGVEGAVLKGALAARTRTRAFLLGAATGAAFLAAAVAFAQTVLHAVSSALPLGDAAVLFLWLFAGAAAIASIVVLALVLLALFRARARGNAEEGSTEIAVAFGVLASRAFSPRAPCSRARARRRPRPFSPSSRSRCSSPCASRAVLPSRFSRPPGGSS